MGYAERGGGRVDSPESFLGGLRSGQQEHASSVRPNGSGASEPTAAPAVHFRKCRARASKADRARLCHAAARASAALQGGERGLRLRARQRLLGRHGAQHLEQRVVSDTTPQTRQRGTRRCGHWRGGRGRAGVSGPGGCGAAPPRKELGHFRLPPPAACADAQHSTAQRAGARARARGRGSLAWSVGSRPDMTFCPHLARLHPARGKSTYLRAAGVSRRPAAARPPARGRAGARLVELADERDSVGVALVDPRARVVAQRREQAAHAGEAHAVHVELAAGAARGYQGDWRGRQGAWRGGPAGVRGRRHAFSGAEGLMRFSGGA